MGVVAFSKTAIRIDHYIRNLSFVYSFFILGAILIIIGILFALVYDALEELDIIWKVFPIDKLAEEHFIWAAFQLVILAPIIETAIGQSAVYRALCCIHYLKKHKYIIIITSGVFWGVMHPYSFFYVLNAFITGSFFMYAYIVKQGKHAYWLVVCLHAMKNGFALLGL